ncbi:hypothetical protein [Pseudomonas paeninsulae]|uniref:hypothetical protein n=1 Tax=Pseudomonas paeninsulae TaxID=3110772 RepID=UPI002D777FFA|nr:hypothetical protein [Pseudomonas sp. IT1137]
MQVNVQFKGLELAKARLAELGRTVEPVLRGALNTTATKARSDRYIKPLRGTIKGARVRRAMKVKRAGKRRSDARVIPSSSGIPVLEYAGWGFDPIDATRARVWVRSPSGKKIAAGFVNPSSAKKQPLSTRSSKTAARGKTYTYKRALGAASGPSAAYWFKQLSGNDTIRWVNVFLRQEFEKRMRKEVAKGIR